MSTSRRRFLAFGASALCTLSLGMREACASPVRVSQARGTAAAAVAWMHLPRHASCDVALPLPRTRAGAFGERREHRHAVPARRACAP